MLFLVKINRCSQIYIVNYELAILLEIERYIKFEATFSFREQRFTITTLTNNFHVAAMSMKQGEDGSQIYGSRSRCSIFSRIRTLS